MAGPRPKVALRHIATRLRNAAAAALKRADDLASTAATMLQTAEELDTLLGSITSISRVRAKPCVRYARESAPNGMGEFWDWYSEAAADAGWAGLAELSASQVRQVYDANRRLLGFPGAAGMGRDARRAVLAKGMRLKRPTATFHPDLGFLIRNLGEVWMLGLRKMETAAERGLREAMSPPKMEETP